jgi:two-component system heavy metal sensor histidine kinase CusS
MRVTRLSMRLGLTVSATCTVLVLVMAMLAYSSLSRQLDIQARDALTEKLGQIAHSITEGANSIADVMLNPHGLRDQIFGHDNFTLNVLDPGNPQKVLLSLGRNEGQPLPAHVLGTLDGAFMQLRNPHGVAELATLKQIRLGSGEAVLAVLSLDRKNDATLLTAYLKSTLVAVPLILLLVGGGAWWVVQRELKPLRTFRKVAAKISASDLSHRMTLEGLPDELRDLAHAINFMFDRLDNDVQQLAQFSDDLAHELRSPINNLMGKAQVTLARERPAAQYQQALESCLEELDRLSKMVSQMLFLASVSQPSAARATGTVQLAEEVQRVVELFSLQAEDKGIQLACSGSGQVLGDRIMLQRAISNLLSNAIRHSPPGTTVSITVAEQEGAVEVAVSNRGEGIEALHFPRLFDRFYRVHASRSRHEGGTGLGLAIVRTIMTLHRGTVTVESVANGITTFRLRLPGNHSPT